MRIAFVVHEFPATTETFIIDQVADLLDRGVDVEVFSFSRGSLEHISDRYQSYNLASRVHYLGWPESKAARIRASIPIMAKLLVRDPRALFRALNVFRYGNRAFSLRLLNLVAPFFDNRFDVVHCHFGGVANRFLLLNDVLRLGIPIVTTFYGADASTVLQQQPAAHYDQLKREGALFLVMSTDMRNRLVAHGFPADKMKVHPVSVDVGAYPFSERACAAAEPVDLLFVGRFVEKKGCDDLLRALAIVKAGSKRTFRCTIVGGGALEVQLKRLADTLQVSDVVRFAGYMKIDELIRMLPRMHILVQPSKTASNGDME